jgi:integrase
LHLNAGEPLIVVSNQLGHSMTRTTELYSHLMPRDLAGRAVPVDAAILAARSQPAPVPKLYLLDDYRRGGVAL